MRADQFLALASPLLVRDADNGHEPIIVLAFVIEAGELGALVVGREGGRASIAPVESLEFPAPIQTRPVLSGQAKLD